VGGGVGLSLALQPRVKPRLNGPIGGRPGKACVVGMVIVKAPPWWAADIQGQLYRLAVVEVGGVVSLRVGGWVSGAHCRR
jgi:hypothetical protein